MKNICLRKMNAEEFLLWKSESLRNYTLEKQKEGLSPEDAKAAAEKSFATYLPDNEKSINQHLYVVIHASSEKLLGYFWWGLQNHGSKQLPWVFDIVVFPENRGKGIGRAIMQEGEKIILGMGFKTLGLHVFGHNVVARSLYESLGFHTTNLVMRKELT